MSRIASSASGRSSSRRVAAVGVEPLELRTVQHQEVAQHVGDRNLVLEPVYDLIDEEPEYEEPRPAAWNLAGNPRASAACCGLPRPARSHPQRRIHAENGITAHGATAWGRRALRFRRARGAASAPLTTRRARRARRSASAYLRAPVALIYSPPVEPDQQCMHSRGLDASLPPTTSTSRSGLWRQSTTDGTVARAEGRRPWRATTRPLMRHRAEPRARASNSSRAQHRRTTSAMASAVRAGTGTSYEGFRYIPVSRLHEGRFGRMFRLPPFVPSDDRIAEIAAAMLEGATGPIARTR